VNFSGRSSRSAFWWWVLASILLSILATVVDTLFFGIVFEDTGPVYSAWSLVTLIPGIALGARRLHDVDKSGWWQLIAFTIIGLIPLIIWLASPTQEGPNRFGEDLEAGISA
jgi:uncharacterized membrane protein YhaH (DUF805 family)